MEWQPIETAPKDGTDILTWTHLPDAFNPYIVVKWKRGTWVAVDPLGEYLPTHWMPLPEPPQ